jgi:hypothetical protein
MFMHVYMKIHSVPLLLEVSTLCCIQNNFLVTRIQHFGNYSQEPKQKILHSILTTCVAKNMLKQISLMQLTVWMANTNINIIVHPVAGDLFCLQHVISHANTMGMKLFYIQC